LFVIDESGLLSISRAPGALSPTARSPPAKLKGRTVL
jgi:hypothetical protein